jgi:hypothetical protein
MKKETKIPKGFELMTSNKNSYHESVMAMRKSIYDKRINLILSECMLKNGTYELYCKIREIDDGDFDGMEH